MRNIDFKMVAGLAFAVTACGGAPRPVSTRPVDPSIGLCVDPDTRGRLSAQPIEKRFDKDLNGDGVLERVAADENLCVGLGNCAWNLYALTDKNATRCWRYLGTIDGKAISELRSQGEEGYADLRGFWELAEDRMLVHEYRYRRGAYELVETLTCTQSRGQALDCRSDRP
jgi:hypothetical protein